MHSIATIVILTIAACAAPALSNAQTPFGTGASSGQAPAGAGAQGGAPAWQGAHGGGGVVATEIKIKNGNETIELTAGPGDSVVLSVEGDPEFGKRVHYKDECIELTNRDGSTLCEIRSLVNDGTGKLVTAPRKVRAYLGASVSFADETLAQQLGLDPNNIGVVTTVTAGSAAATAGLQVHDVITRIGGEPAGRGDRMRAVLDTKKPGEELRLRIVRKGKTQEIVVKLGALDEGSKVAHGGVPFLGDIPIIGLSFRTGEPAAGQGAPAGQGERFLEFYNSRGELVARKGDPFAGGAGADTNQNSNNTNPDDRAAGIWRGLSANRSLRMSGRVTDSKGDPIPNANITGVASEPAADAIESLLRRLEERLDAIESKIEALQRK